jgi:hypothetical protein
VLEGHPAGDLLPHRLGAPTRRAYLIEGIDGGGLAVCPRRAVGPAIRVSTSGARKRMLGRRTAQVRGRQR